MKCTYSGCDNEIDRSHPRANNKKFCSVRCRENHYIETGKTKRAHDTANHNRYNQYAPGKEQCVICAGWYKAVCMHAAQRHKITAAEYKELIGADRKKGRLIAYVREVKAQHVFENGTVNNLKRGAPYRFKPGDLRAGRYERRPETIARLKQHIKTISKK